MKIRLKLITAFLIVCIIVWIVGIFSLGISQKVLQESIGRHSSDVVVQTANKLSNFLAVELEEQSGFSTTLAIRILLEASNREFDKKRNVQEYISARDERWQSESQAELLNNTVSQILRMRILEHTSLYGVIEYGEIFITNKYGAVVAMSDKTTDYRQDDERWWQEAKTTGYFVSDVEYDESSSTIGIPIAVSITDASGNFLGALKVVLRFAIMANIFQDLQKSETFREAHIKLLDSSGRILYSTTEFYFKQKQSPEITKMLTNDKGYFIQTEPREEEALFSYARSKPSGKFQGLGWVVLAEHPSKTIFAPLAALRKIILILSAIAVLLALLVGGFVSSSLSDAAGELATKAGLVQKGHLKVKTSIHTHDELEEAGHAFNSMAKQLAAEKSKVVKRQKEIEKAQLALTHMVGRLKDSYEKLQALDKLKDEFLQSTSHELRTPLTSLLGFVRLMKDGSLGAFTKKQLEGINVIETDARIEAGKKLEFTSFDFNKLVRELAEPLSLAAKSKKLNFTLELKPLPKIIADRYWIGTVVSNLIHNAIKYTNQGSITVEARKTNSHISFKVKDSGIGIRPEHIASLFSKFFQVTHTTSGSGLGLYICKKIIEQHKGKLWAESEYGKGTTFFFTIPLKQ